MIKKFKDCQMLKEGRKWVHIYSASSAYTTPIKILRDDSFHFENGDTLYLEHMGKSYFRFVESETTILDFRNEDISRYFKNAISKNYIYRFLREYREFQVDYLENGTLNTQKTISIIDDGLMEYSKTHKKVNLDDILGEFNPFRKHYKIEAELKELLETGSAVKTKRKIINMDGLFINVTTKE